MLGPMPTRRGDVIIEERDDTTICWVTTAQEDDAQVGDAPEAIPGLKLALDHAATLRAPGGRIFRINVDRRDWVEVIPPADDT